MIFGLCAWLTSLRMMSSSSIHLPANDKILLFFMACTQFHCVQVPHFLDPFISSGEFCCFITWLLWIVYAHYCYNFCH
jgi:hypothetical protein